MGAADTQYETLKFALEHVCGWNGQQFEERALADTDLRFALYTDKLILNTAYRLKEKGEKSNDKT